MKRIWNLDRVRGTLFDLEPIRLKRDQVNAESIPARKTTLGAAKRRMKHSVEKFGILQPGLFEKNSHGYNLVAGRHRLEQALASGEDSFDGLVIKWMGEAVEDEELQGEIKDALRDETNFASVQWTELETARYLFLDRFPGWTPPEVAEFMDIPEKDVARLSRLARIPESVANRVIEHTTARGRDGFDRGAIDKIADEAAVKTNPMSEAQLLELVEKCIATNAPITEQTIKAVRDSIKGIQTRGRKKKQEGGGAATGTTEQLGATEQPGASAGTGEQCAEGEGGGERGGAKKTGHRTGADKASPPPRPIATACNALLEQLRKTEQLPSAEYEEFVKVQPELVSNLMRVVTAGAGA